MRRRGRRRYRCSPSRRIFRGPTRIFPTSLLSALLRLHGPTVTVVLLALAVGIPVLRKDFTVDSYMIYEARTLGAAAVLLIAALLDGDTLRDYIGVAHSLGLSALVEAHTAEETEVAVKAGARIIGVNNRDLRTFQVDTGNCLRLRPLVPRSVLFVAESGVRTAADIDRLRAGGVDAVLVGETLMRAPDRKAALAALRGTP